LATTQKELENEFELNKVIEKVKDTTFQVVNRLIDAYRFVTKEEYITRLGEVKINMIYFINLNQGFILSQANTETAPMNRSTVEIEKIEKMLENGEAPDLSDLLELDTRNSFNAKNYPLAVLQSFQSLEIFLENFLLKEILGKGKTEQEATGYLIQGNNWTTKTRLKELLKEFKGKSIQEIDSALWDAWCTTYDTVRTAVIHKGKEPDFVKIKEAIENNFKVIKILKSLN
jgi:hypothetical protein